MTTQRLGLALGAIILLASAAFGLLGLSPALADDGPVKLTIKVTDTGFDPSSIDVPAGAQVELTFVWDNANHPDDEHIIVIPGYKLESEKIDRTNKQTVLSFIANKTGSFLFKCDFECDTHDILQHGNINVVAAGAASGGAASGGTGAGSTGGSAAPSGGASLQVSQFVIDPVAGIVVNGNSVSIAAKLQSKDGKPISKADVAFYAERTFLGRKGEVPIATGKTDSAGNVYAIYHPTNSDGGTITARFEGAGLYDGTEQKVNLAGSPQFQPGAQSSPDDNLHGIKRVAPFALIGIIAFVWLVFAFLLFQAWGISRVHSEGRPSQ